MTVTNPGTGTVTPDHYPTRVGDHTTLIERVDPTVWSGATDGPIDPATLAAYDANGYSVVEGLLSPAEVQGYWQELARLSADEALRDDERTVVEDGSNEVRTIYGVHRISELIGELVCDPRVLDRARQILGSEVYVHQSRVNYRPGFSDDGSYWHSDFETWHAEDGMPSPRAVSVSITLTDTHPFNGGLMMMPGSHRTFISCAGEADEDQDKHQDEDPDEHGEASSTDQEIGVPSELDLTKMAAEQGIEQFTGSAGSALVSDANVLHGAGNNITPYPRSNIFLVFNSVENTLVEPFGPVPPRPDYLANRDFTAICR